MVEWHRDARIPKAEDYSSSYAESYSLKPGNQGLYILTIR